MRHEHLRRELLAIFFGKPAGPQRSRRTEITRMGQAGGKGLGPQSTEKDPHELVMVKHGATLLNQPHAG